MRYLFAGVVGVFILIAIVAVVPLLRESAATLNTTANITEYEGMWQAVQFAPLALIFIFGALVIFWILGIRIRGKLPIGD